MRLMYASTDQNQLGSGWPSLKYSEAISQSEYLVIAKPNPQSIPYSRFL